MIRVLWFFSKSLSRIAAALEQIASLYRLDLATRGILETNPGLKDEVEVVYGYRDPEDD